MGPQKGLNDYLSILNSPEAYPNIAGAGFFLSPVISIASTIIAYAGIIATILVFLRVAADVLIISGLNSALGGVRGGSTVGGWLSRFATKGVEETCEGEPLTYLKHHAYKILIMIMFIGLMVSGQMLPLAGTLTASAGAAIARIANINPVPYIEAVQIDFSGITDRLGRSSIDNLIDNYNKHIQNMASSKKAFQGNLTEEELDSIALAYTNSYIAAKITGLQMDIINHNSLLDTMKVNGRRLTSEEERLRSFNTKSHEYEVDYRLINRAVKVSTTNLDNYLEDLRNAEKELKEMMNDREYISEDWLANRIS